MIVPNEILQKLKCSNCNDLLSCGPVLFKQNGNNICGRCSGLDETAVPNMPYNELAEMCAFPCKYEASGCYEKITFKSMKEHEADCVFRSYICPVMPSGSCEWVGTRNKILEHIQEAHPEKMLPHPCKMEHDMKTACLKSFLSAAFNVLFLIQTKVCLTTYTIYHSVRKIGEIGDNRLYKYELKVDNENGSLIRRGQVAPQGCLALQEDTSIDIKINSMMEALKGFKDSKFFITIYEHMKCFMCAETRIASEIAVFDKINEIFVCLSCSLLLKSCKNSTKGCPWKGNNVVVHKNLFCSFSTLCQICECNITESNMLDHIQKNSHKKFEIKHLDKNFGIVKDDNQLQSFSFNSKRSCYLLTCKKQNDQSYKFGVVGYYNDVRKMKCYLRLKNPNTNYFAYFGMKEMFTDFYGQFIWQADLSKETLENFIVSKLFKIDIDIYCSE